MSLAYHILDVFTDRALAGNPLAVVLDADRLDAERMQAIAREFNLSETVFVMDPRDPVNSARVRIFTPTQELPFAGHPTVGTAVLLARLRAPEILARQDLALVIEEEIGPVHCIARQARGVTRASFTLPRLPEIVGEPPQAGALAAALSLGPDDIGFEAHRPVAASAGNPFTFVPLASLDALARAQPDAAHWQGIGAVRAVFPYVRTDTGYRARMFALGKGFYEDPATGSAVAAFAGVLTQAERFADGDHTIEIEQGVEMGRPSRITLGLDMAAGRLAGASIAGAAVTVAQGTLAL